MDHRPEPVAVSSLRGWLVLAGATLVAVVSARDYVASWFDSSRLATVECLVDYHTLAIDQSVFLNDPARSDRHLPSPYPHDLAHMRVVGTGDRMWINGHFYSDKSPVPALWMAGVYQVWQWLTGITVREQPNRFCYGMTLASSGLAYVVAVWCMYRLAVVIGLSPLYRFALPISLALSTVALPYVRHVNNHIMMLGVTAALVLGVTRLAQAVEKGSGVRWRLLGLGTLLGMGYAIELAIGPILLVATVALVAYRCRRWQSVAVVLLAALPWLALHHAINYALSGTIRPASSVPANWQWPGSPFNGQNLTGVYNHPSALDCGAYAVALLFGKRGFLPVNPTLLLAVLAWFVLMRRRIGDKPELLWAATWSVGAWLVYAVLSTNFGGQCFTIRWFVPLVAPGYLVLVLFVRWYPRYGWAFLALSAWGVVLEGEAWWRGPWRAGVA